MKSENLCHRLHLVLVGFVQPDPDERGLSLVAHLPHLRERIGVGEPAGQPRPVDVDRAVDHRAGDRHMDPLDVRADRARVTPSSAGGIARNDGIFRPPVARANGCICRRHPNGAGGYAPGPVAACDAQPTCTPATWLKYPDAVAETVKTSHLVIEDEEIFDAHVGGKLSIELKAPLDTQRACRSPTPRVSRR